MTEVRSARYICAGEISSRGPSEGLQGSQQFHFSGYNIMNMTTALSIFL